MTDVVHSVNLDQRLDFPHDPVTQYYPHNTPASIATTTPIQPHSASFGGFDLTGELAQSNYCSVNFFEANWQLIAAMLSSDQDLNNLTQSNVSSSSQQQQQQQQQQNNSRQYNEMTAAAFPNQHQYSHDTSVQQTSMLQPSPPFVEPSGNYIAIPSTTANQNLSYGYPSSTLPNNNNQTIALTNNLDNGNVGNNFSSSISSRNVYMGNPNQQSQQQQQQQHHHHHSINSQLIQGFNFNHPNHCLNQKEIYQTSIPSSIGTNSCQQHQVNHQKSIPSSVNSNYPRQDAAATSLPISIAPNIYMNAFNNQTSNGSTMIVPLFEPPTQIFTTKPATPAPATISISQNSSSTSETTSPTKQTYSYSGPPKSYYSRLPLYDRPFKCDECPQSFNRNHDLKRHKRIHLAVKPYPCQYCEKQFSRKDALKRHVLVKGCNNTSNKRSTASSASNNNNNNKSAVTSPTNSSISTIKSYVDNGGPIKTEPNDNNGYGMSI